MFVSAKNVQICFRQRYPEGKPQQKHGNCSFYFCAIQHTDKETNYPDRLNAGLYFRFAGVCCLCFAISSSLRWKFETFAGFFMFASSCDLMLASLTNRLITKF